jgi:hypothetical protein
LIFKRKRILLKLASAMKAFTAAMKYVWVGRQKTNTHARDLSKSPHFIDLIHKESIKIKLKSEIILSNFTL